MTDFKTNLVKTFTDNNLTLKGSDYAAKLKDLKSSIGAKARTNLEKVVTDHNGNGKSDEIENVINLVADAFSTAGDLNPSNIASSIDTFDKIAPTINLNAIQDSQFPLLGKTKADGNPNTPRTQTEIGIVAMFTGGDVTNFTVDSSVLIDSPTPSATPPAPAPTTTTTLPADATADKAKDFLLANKGNFLAVKNQWNDWKAANTDKYVDLAGEDLSGADFTDADLTECSLIGADLTGVNLTGAKLARTYLVRSASSDYYLNYDGSLTVVDLSTSTSVKDTDEKKQEFLAYYNDTLLKDVPTIGDALINSKPLATVVKNLETSLTPATTTTPSLDSVTFEPSNKDIWMAALIPTNGTEGTPFMLGGTTYKYAADGKLQKNDGPGGFVDVSPIPPEIKDKQKELIIKVVDTATDLVDRNLSSADLTDINLTNANLTNANLTGADLYNADLTGANLTGANLTGVVVEANGKFYKIMSSNEIQVSDNGSSASWTKSDDKDNNLKAINAFKEIINKAAKDPNNAEIDSKPLNEVITALEEANKKPVAKTGGKSEPDATQIQGIDRAKFGGLLGKNETYPSWQATNMIQAALNERIQRGEIKTDLLVQDGVFGSKTAEAAQTWLNTNSGDLLTHLVYGTSIPDDKSKFTANQTKGLMLGVGSSGTEVGKLQTELNKPTRRGLEINLTVDGKYGPATEKAVIAFQKWYNTQHSDPNSQLDVDGVAGPNTIAALKLDLSKP